MAVDPPFSMGKITIFHGKITISMEDHGGFFGTFFWHIELWLIFRRRVFSMAFEV